PRRVRAAEAPVALPEAAAAAGAAPVADRADVAERGAGEGVDERLPAFDRGVAHLHVELGVDELVLLHRVGVRRVRAHDALERVAYVVGRAERAVGAGRLERE